MDQFTKLGPRCLLISQHTQPVTHQKDQVEWAHLSGLMPIGKKCGGFAQCVSTVCAEPIAHFDADTVDVGASSAQVHQVPACTTAVVEYACPRRQRDPVEQINLLLPECEESIAPLCHQWPTIERQLECFIVMIQRIEHREAEGRSRHGDFDEKT